MNPQYFIVRKGKWIFPSLYPTLPMIALAIIGGWLAFGSSGCSLNDSKPRSIRAHSTPHNNIAHADPALRAERYCQGCHGLHLVGGDQTPAPSCYQCHGRNWLAIDPNASNAPADHTVANGIYMHHPDRYTSVGTCTTCHGNDLRGANGTPSCYLCHDQLWQ